MLPGQLFTVSPLQCSQWIEVLIPDQMFDIVIKTLYCCPCSNFNPVTVTQIYSVTMKGLGYWLSTLVIVQSVRGRRPRQLEYEFDMFKFEPIRDL